MKQYIILGKTFINTYESMWNLLPQSALYGSMIFFINKFLFNDWEFSIFLAIAVVVDTFLGVVKNLVNHKLSLEKMNKFTIKLICYLSLLIILHVLMNFTVQSQKQVTFQWLDTVVYTLCILRESISILKHIHELLPGFLPKFLVSYLERVKDKLEGDDYKDKIQE